MSASLDAKDVDLQPYLCYDKDGLVDLFLGLGIVLFGLVMASAQVYLAGIIPALLLPLWQVGKKAITVSRVASDELPPAQAEQVVWTRAILLGMSVGVLLLGLLVYGLVISDRMSAEAQAWIGRYLLLGLGVAGALGLCGIAFVNQCRRFYGYGLLALVVVVGGYLLSIVEAVQALVVGTAVLLSGALVLVHFLRSHPVVHP